MDAAYEYEGRIFSGTKKDLEQRINYVDGLKRQIEDNLSEIQRLELENQGLQEEIASMREKGAGAVLDAYGEVVLPDSLLENSERRSARANAKI
jgi:hypothetical protein